MLSYVLHPHITHSSMTHPAATAAGPSTNKAAATVKLRALPAVKTRSGGYRGIIPLGYIGASDRYGNYYLPRTYRSQALPVMVRMHHSSADACLMHPRRRTTSSLQPLSFTTGHPARQWHEWPYDGAHLTTLACRAAPAEDVRQCKKGGCRKKKNRQEGKRCLFAFILQVNYFNWLADKFKCVPPPFFLHEFPPCGNLIQSSARAACAQLVYMSTCTTAHFAC